MVYLRSKKKMKRENEINSMKKSKRVSKQARKKQYLNFYLCLFVLELDEYIEYAEEQKCGNLFLGFCKNCNQIKRYIERHRQTHSNIFNEANVSCEVCSFLSCCVRRKNTL